MELVTHAKKIASMSTKNAKGVALLCFDAVLPGNSKLSCVQSVISEVSCWSFISDSILTGYIKDFATFLLL